MCYKNCKCRIFLNVTYRMECKGVENEVFTISTSFLTTCIIFGRANCFVQWYLDIYIIHDCHYDSVLLFLIARDHIINKLT